MLGVQVGHALTLADLLVAYHFLPLYITVRVCCCKGGGQAWYASAVQWENRVAPSNSGGALPGYAVVTKWCQIDQSFSTLRRSASRRCGLQDSDMQHPRLCICM